MLPLGKCLYNVSLPNKSPYLLDSKQEFTKFSLQKKRCYVFRLFTPLSLDYSTLPLLCNVKIVLDNMYVNIYVCVTPDSAFLKIADV